MTERLFRQEVIEAGRDRLTGTVVVATPPRASIYTLGTIIFAIVAVLFLSFGEYATKAEVRGVVAQSGGIAHVVVPASAEVVTVLVNEGQHVEKGQPLLAISLTQGRDAQGFAMASQLAELDRQDRELAQQEQLASLLGGSEGSSLGQRKAALAQVIASLSRQRTLKHDQLVLAKANHRRAIRLAKEAAGTQQQVEDTQGEILARSLELEGLSERIHSQSEVLIAIDSSRSTTVIGALRSKSEIAQKRAALAEQKLSLARQDRLELAAPISGIVGDIAVKAGQRVEPNNAAMAIIPKDSRLEVQLFAPSRAVGFVRPGQEVRLLFDAFPYQKFGSGKGAVTWVSQVPSQSAESPAQPDGAPLFRIRVALDNQRFTSRSINQPLRAGMTLTGNLVLERRSLWEVFFDPILKAIRT